MPVKPLHSIRNIGVIVGRDLVGDALIKLPFVRALRNAFPDARIHWITSEGPTFYASALREPTRGLIDEVHETPEWACGPAFGGGAPFFDLLIDTRNRWKLALQAKKIPHSAFLALALRTFLSDRRLPFWQNKTPHMVDRLLQLVELASGQQAQGTGALAVRQDLVEKARAILPPGKIYVGMAIGAGNPIKIWPRYKFEKLAALQAARGRIPVFILGPQERAEFTALSTLLPSAKFPLQEKSVWGEEGLSIDHTLAIASLLDVAVSNDSGVGHMLAAVDCKLISLFGPTSAEKLAPRVSRGLVIRAQDFGSDRMKDITWEAVDAAVDGMLAKN